MKICMVAEGCYPYVVGGVSSWIHSMIRSFPEHEFIILAIVADRETGGKFKYELPENVSAVYEVYLNDDDWGKENRKRMSKKEYEALRSVVVNRTPDWEGFVKIISKPDFSYNDLVMGMDFYEAVKEAYSQKYTDVPFVDFLWTMRSMYLPLILVMSSKIPEADLYHCVATGYAGVLGAMAKMKYGCKLLVSEHGIYTREREEELIKATWVQGLYKDIWIDQFKKMSQLAYDQADVVTSLFAHASELQQELGCDKKKLRVTPNGVDASRFADIPQKTEEDKAYVNIGAVVRVTPIKDIKTLIRAFAYAKNRVKNLKLWIMGPCDEDEEYAKECFDIVEAMELEDVVFTDRVDVTQYMGRMDYTVLTSISEGQPLTILEGFAAKKPVVATDVGNCRGLIYGEGDDYGQAGILTHIMNVEEIANAFVALAMNPEMTKQMGEVGYRRLIDKYLISQMKDTYKEIYDRLSGE
ncbi:MAG: GT4 family glycosyltransferase PelF [Lachnospiraceae bacterium]|nr:GT4 family glycosyltransferase PelF [Lachnospiraceae bacterium]